MLQTKYFLKIILTALLILLPVQAWAATVNKMRYSSSPTRVRIVLDTDEKVKYKDEKQGSSIVVNIDAAVAKEMSEKVKDPIIKSVVLKKDGQLPLRRPRNAGGAAAAQKRPAHRHAGDDERYARGCERGIFD